MSLFLRTGRIRPAYFLCLLALFQTHKTFADHEIGTPANQTGADSKAKVDPILFRSMFRCFLDKDYSEREKNEMVFLPTKEMQQQIKAKTADEYLSKLSSINSKITPTDLYEEGVRTPNKDIDCKAAEAKLREKPLTIVLVPGIFGEFIDNRAFEEVFKGDKTFDPASNTYKAVVNGKDGKPLFTFILFRTPRMSFESMGDIGKMGKVFSDRLDTFVKNAKSGEAENLALLGYSRGTPMGLQMLSYANSQATKPKWLDKTRAMISLGGVTFGSDLADEALKPGTPTYGQLNAIYNVADKLNPEKRVNRLGIDVNRFNNDLAWGKFGIDMAIASRNPSPLLNMLFAVKKTDLGGTRDLVWGLGKDFGLNNFNQDYAENITRFKNFARELRTGTEQLSGASRRDWWEKNTIPTKGLKYYTVGGVMSQPGTPLGDSTVDYDKGSPDEANLINGNADYTKVSGTKLNDSQVDMGKNQIRPDLATLMNPSQKPFDHQLMGILGTTHWGLALKSVTPPSENPFPRETLLKAIAASVAQGMDDERR
jgi:hypothetical protein